MHPSTIFENSFAQASTFRTIQQTFFQLCTSLDISPSNTTEVYEKLSLLDRGKDHSKAYKLWTLLEKRRNQTEYCSQKACNRLNVLVIGAGPCGLRAAIEYALLGAHVIVVEQRDKFSRNNVLHLWDFVIHDLKALGAKIFYPKFCTGSIDHISIRRLQCILLKIALVLGVNVHENISFLGLNEPSVDEPSTSGWRANFEPFNHILSEYVFDVVVGADGKRNTLPGFARKIVRGKLAIGITANFINNKTSAEEKVSEISGVAYIFNQTFFKELLRETGIALENVVYYKNDTHYFVMCAQKQSLLQKGVIKKDFDDIPTLLSKENVDQEMLCKFAAQAADFATNGQLPQLVFAQNSRAKPDCAMFDFTALSSALYSTRLVERNSKHLIMTIVGDSLHEPFWPTGSGIARGFLSIFDSAWMLRSFGLNNSGPTEIIAERENVYKLLAQTTKENMCKIISKYTIDPKTRYKQIDHSVDPDEVVEQVDTDNPRMRPTCKPLPLRIDSASHSGESPEHLSPEFARKYELWMFCHRILLPFKLKVVNFKAQSWGDGRPLAALVGKFRPSLIDYIALCAENNPEKMLDEVFGVVESEFGVPPPCNGQMEWATMPEECRVEYLEKLMYALLSDRELVQKKLVQTPVRVSSEYHNGVSSFNVYANQLEDNNNGAEQTSLENSEKEQKRGFIKRFAGRVVVDDEQQLGTATKIRQVNKLNPAIVCKVQQIMTGSLDKEKSKELYEEKYRNFQRLVKKIEKEDLIEMENKMDALDATVTQSNRKANVNSQEEKLMRINAADARQKAIDGYSGSENRYEEVDKKLFNAKNSIKMLPLAGLESVSKFRECKPEVKEVITKFIGPLPSTPPKPTTICIGDDFEKETTTNLHPIISTSYVSPNAKKPAQFSAIAYRRSQKCSVCGEEVYLAEQLLVEKMVIHKKCFKCSYCAQTLRLDNCFLDRYLQAKYGSKWYCKTHFSLPFTEKVNKLERTKRKVISDGWVEGRQAVAVVNPMPSPSNENEKRVEVPDIPWKEDNIAHLEDFNSPTSLVSKAMERVRSREVAADLLYPAVEKAKNGVESSVDRLFEKPEAVEFMQSEQDGGEFNMEASLVKKRSISQPEAAQDEIAELQTKRRQSMINAMKLINLAKSEEKEVLKQKQDICLANTRSEKPVYMSDSESSLDSNNYQDEDFSSASEESKDEVWEEFKEMLETIISKDFIQSLSAEQASGLIENFNRAKTISTMPLKASCPNSMIKEGGLNTPTHHGSNNSLYFTPNTHFYTSDPKSRPKSMVFEQLPSATAVPNKPSHNTPTRSESTKEANLIRQVRRNRLNRQNPRRSTVSVDFAREVFEPSYRLLNERTQAAKLPDTANRDSCLSEVDVCKASTGSPRKTLTNTTPSVFLVPSPKNIKEVQVYAQKISLRREQESQRSAQELQRQINEIETRLIDVSEVGSELESKLQNDTQNTWLLENWRLYAQEFSMLLTREKELNKKIQEAHTVNEYKRLKSELSRLQQGENDSCTDIGHNSEEERRIMKKLIEILDEHNQIKADLEELKTTKNHILYKDFEPVFLKD